MTILIFSILIFLTSSYGNQTNKKIGNFDSVEYSLDLTSLSYTFQDENADQTLELVPVNNIQAGFSVTKYGYSIGFSFEDPSNSETTKELGRSKAFDFQVSSTFQRHYLEVFYQKYQGLGIKIDNEQNPIDFNYESLNYGLQGMFFLKSSYDPYESLFHFTHNLKENSSMLLAIEASKNRLKNNNGILPQEYNSLYPEFIDVREVSQNNLALMFGYTRLDKFDESYHTQFLVALGPNYAKTHYTGGDIQNSSKTGSKIVVDFDLGRIYGQSIFGLSAKSSMTSLKGSRTSQLNNTRLKAQIYYHYFF